MEFEIDKKLGIKGPDDVMKIGIAQYNGECRKIVSRYAAEWEVIMNRLGRWIGKMSCARGEMKCGKSQVFKIN